MYALKQCNIKEVPFLPNFGGFRSVSYLWRFGAWLQTTRRDEQHYIRRLPSRAQLVLQMGIIPSVIDPHSEKKIGGAPSGGLAGVLPTRGGVGRGWGKGDWELRLSPPPFTKSHMFAS